jgi:phosphoribosylformylglycinamidine synthase II
MDIKITEEVIKEHGLSGEEYQKILKILGREPNYTELGIFSVMWSEHCSYKSSKVHLEKLPTKGEHIIEGPGENAGVVDIGDGLAAVFKIESHNHPSFIEPFQGAATGVGGILRDIFTMGARPVASMNSLRFGPLDSPKNRYLLERVVEGIAGYGNCMGIPTVGGEIYFSGTYTGNPLVNAFNLGIVKKDRIFRGKASGVGNAVIYVGSKTGRDGIHGATMASEEFDETSEERRPTVLVGDPFTEKLLLEACLEAMKKDCIVGIQDMGAAGLTCSTCEMAGRGDAGVDIDISLVPRREEGMNSYEIMLSESQERMLLVVEKGKEDEIKDIFKKWDLEAVHIGEVTDDGILRVRENGKTVVEIPAKPLSEEAPKYQRPAKEPALQKEIQQLDLDSIREPKDLNKILNKLISSPSISSKKFVYEQYDHMVRINTVVYPGSDAAVIRIPDSKRGLAMTLDGNSRYCYLDPYEGGKTAVAEAARNLVCCGAKPLAITNCLNFGNPEKPDIMWQFSRVIKGMAEACNAFQTPVTGGNVSFYNETLGKGIYPTPVIGMIGLLDDCESLTQWFKDEGDIIVLLGESREELGASEYLSVVHGLEKGKPPEMDLEREKRVQEVCLEAFRNKILKSAHDCSEGGLAVALTEACISSINKRGAEIEMENNIRADALLFGETQSRIIVSLREEDVGFLKKIASKHKVPCSVIGKVKGKRLKITDKKGKRTMIDTDVASLKESWEGGLGRFFNG